jgi:hypothetical protein
MLVAIVIALAVIAFVAWPLVARRATGRATAASSSSVVDTDRIEERIGEYRQALRRRTVCERCLYANPQSSRFCAECGARLPAADTAGSATRPS